MDQNRIYSTKNYAIFKNLVANRDLDIKKLNNIKVSMTEKALNIPIIINENYEVIDGQHRLEASKQLGLPVFYIVKEGFGIKEVQRANINQSNWKGKDFLKYYCELNNPHYLIFRKFQEKWKFNININLALLCDRQITNRSFALGNFRVKDEAKANKLAEQIHSIKPYYSGYSRRSFILALLRATDNKDFEFKEFFHKLGYLSQKMVHCTDSDQYLKLIEDLYNYKRNPANKIRLT